MKIHFQYFSNHVEYFVFAIYKKYSRKNWYKFYILLFIALKKNTRTNEKISQIVKKKSCTTKNNKKQNFFASKSLFLNENFDVEIETKTKSQKFLSTYLNLTNNVDEIDFLLVLIVEKYLNLKIKYVEKIERFQNKTFNLNHKIRENLFRKMFKYKQKIFFQIINNKIIILWFQTRRIDTI